MMTLIYDEAQMVNKYMKNCSTLVGIRKMHLVIIAIMKQPQTWQGGVEKTFLSCALTSAGGHVDVHGHVTTKGHAHVKVSAATWDYVDVLSLCCCWRLWWCPWSVQLKKAILMSVVCTVTRNHTEVHDTCRHWTPCGCPYSMLSPETICKSMIHAPTYCKGQGSYSCHGIDFCRCTVEKEGHKSLLW